MPFELERIKNIVEAILFTADRPVSIDRIKEPLAEITNEAQIKEALELIKNQYQSQNFGFELREAQGGFHFCTKIENADWVRKYLQSKPFRLGKSTLETLSIIAYRQPITRADIDRVRGIDSSHLLRSLIERGLVKMGGKAEIPGRPVLYGTTPKFLEVMGLNALSDLPPLSELEQLKGTVDESMNESVNQMEQNLERFVDEKLTTTEEPTGQYQEGLDQIDDMLSQALAADREVFESETHAELARVNIEAVEGFQLATRPKRRTIQYTEIVETAIETVPLKESVVDSDIGNA